MSDYLFDFQDSEGTTFKAVLPLDEGLTGAGDGVGDGVEAEKLIDNAVIDAINDGVSDGVKRQLVDVAKVIQGEPGIIAEAVAKKIKKAKPTAERYIRMLRILKVIEFKGAQKTGGYFLTNNFQSGVFSRE